MSVNRYDVSNGGAQWCQGCYCMKEDELGDYVKYEDYEALQAELAGLREWRPIESAPKDGSYIWLGMTNHMRVGFWLDGKEHENYGTIDGGWLDMAKTESPGTYGLAFAPTHWAPVPVPLPPQPEPQTGD